MTKPSNVKALETGSGLLWGEWVQYLDSINAQELDHTAMAVKTLEKIREIGKSKSPEWWAQGVAVAYEQYIGRRKPGQRCDGDFSVTVSKTIDGAMDIALEKWMKRVDGVLEFGGVKISREPSVTQTEKWRYWRCGLEDGSTLSVNIQTKPNGIKSGLAINHDKLSEAGDVEKWRSFWKSFEV
ncbi:MAG: hypothetical protein Q4G63_08145 [Bacteroidia bacterium]|nr:hypothetical protein [Bacteroidia bacterium]